MIQEELKKYLENKELMKGIVEVETPDALVKLLEDNGIKLEESISPEEAFKLVKSRADDELSDDELDNANGGIALTLALSSAAYLIVGSGALSFLGGYAYQTIKKWK